MVLAYELLLGSLQLANLIKDGKTFQIPNVMTTGKASGLRTMDDSLTELLKAGVITGETAYKNALNVKAFAQYAPKEGGAAAAGAAAPAQPAAGAAAAPRPAGAPAPAAAGARPPGAPVPPRPPLGKPPGKPGGGA